MASKETKSKAEIEVEEKREKLREMFKNLRAKKSAPTLAKKGK
jgi:hypothetical protein